MTFLEDAKKHSCFCNSKQQKSENKARGREQAVQEEISAFFQDKRAPLAEKNINVVQNHDGRARKISIYAERNAQNHSGFYVPAAPDEQRLSFASCNDNSQSSSYFSWSSSKQRSSPPAQISGARIRQPKITYLQRRHETRDNRKEALESFSSECLSNTVCNKTYLMKQCLNAPKSESEIGPSSRHLSAISGELTRWHGQRIVDDANDCIKSKHRRNDIAFAKAGSSHSIFSATSMRQVKPENTHGRGVESQPQGADYGQRSSSSLGRLINECEDALAHRECEEGTILDNSAIERQRRHPEHVDDYPLYPEGDAVPHWQRDSEFRHFQVRST